MLVTALPVALDNVMSFIPDLKIGEDKCSENAALLARCSG